VNIIRSIQAAGKKTMKGRGSPMSDALDVASQKRVPLLAGTAEHSPTAPLSWEELVSLLDAFSLKAESGRDRHFRTCCKIDFR